VTVRVAVLVAVIVPLADVDCVGLSVTESVADGVTLDVVLAVFVLVMDVLPVPDAVGDGDRVPV